MNAGMGPLLTIGWLVLTAYLVILLALSAVIGAVNTVKGWFQQVPGRLQLAQTQEVDHS